MRDYQYAAIRAVGIAIMVAAAIVGGWSCGDQYGRDHAAQH